MLFFNENINKEKYIIAEYFIKSSSNSDLFKCSWNLAIGQSVGNPNIRNQWETEELFENHSCVILDQREKGGGR